jgi:hypothetical protein
LSYSTLPRYLDANGLAWAQQNRYINNKQCLFIRMKPDKMLQNGFSTKFFATSGL